MTIGDNDSESAQRGERDSDSFVRSLARGLSVIRAFGPKHGSMTLSGICSPATAD